MTTKTINNAIEQAMTKFKEGYNADVQRTFMNVCKHINKLPLDELRKLDLKSYVIMALLDAYDENEKEDIL